MKRGKRNWRESIRVRYFFTVISVFIALIATSLIFYTYIDHEQREMAKKSSAFEKRYKVVEEIDATLSDTVLRGRGYVAFNSGSEKAMLEHGLVKLEHQIKEFKELKLNVDEEEYIEELERFYNEYRYDILPETFKLMGDGDTSGVEAIHKDKAGNIINDELERTNQFKNNYHRKIHQLQNEMLENSRNDAIVASIFSAVFLLILLPLVGVIINRIIRPIEALEGAADQITKGVFAKLPERKTNDEIGRLTDSFRKMAHTIQMKEEDLLTHNEELIAQQAELEEQQEKVQKSLYQVENTNDILQRLNKLNHHLTFTLDKHEICNIFHDFLNRQFIFDRSIFWFNKEKIYASNNVTRDVVDDLVETGRHVDLLRLHEEQSYVVKRKTRAEETGLAEEAFDAFDLYCSVLNASHEVVAIFAATRLGHPFLDEEIEEINGLMQRMGLAIGRIYLYEDATTARQLNMDIVQNINEGIQLIDMEGNMVQSNETVRNYVNCNSPGHDWLERQKIGYQEWTQTFLDLSTEQNVLAAYFKEAVDYPEMADKSLCYEIGNRKMSVYAAPVYRLGKRVSTLLVHRDITKEYEIDRMKSELVSTVSHELRTPLSSVLGFTELLLTKELKEERRKKYLETIHKEAKRLTNLINDFLDIQRMEAGKQIYHMENVRMDELAMNVLNRFSAEKNHKIYLLDEAPNVCVQGDADRLEQVLTNVVGNAVKFMPEGGDIEIKLCNQEHQLLIHIRDEGMGIPKTELTKLFTKFHRVDNSEQRKIGGTGLGLAISREIIEYHGGEISLESKEGIGTTVIISLPLNDERIEVKPIELNRQDSCSVMIVEDDMSIALLLSEELKSKGFTVIHHYNPLHAYEEALELPLVGIVVDLMLGDDVSGWELIGMLKENEKTKSIPIIISSALDPDSGRTKSYQIEKYLTKPYNPEELTKALNAFLQPEKTHGQVLFPKVEE